MSKTEETNTRINIFVGLVVSLVLGGIGLLSIYKIVQGVIEIL